MGTVVITEVFFRVDLGEMSYIEGAVSFDEDGASVLSFDQPLTSIGMKALEAYHAAFKEVREVINDNFS